MGQCRAKGINGLPEIHVYVRIDNTCLCQYIQRIAGWKRGFSLQSATTDSGPQGYGLEVTKKGPKALSARLGVAFRDRPQTGQDLSGQEAPG
jgi:hypothetical protein